MAPDGRELRAHSGERDRAEVRSTVTAPRGSLLERRTDERERLHPRRQARSGVRSGLGLLSGSELRAGERDEEESVTQVRGGSHWETSVGSDASLLRSGGP